MSDKNFSHRFPQYLSRPIQILWFETDELVLGLFTLTLALIYGNIMWPVFFVSQFLYTRTKRKNSRGFLKHLLYALGFLNIKGYPAYFEREFHE